MSQLWPDVSEQRADLVSIRLGSFAHRLRRLEHLVTVFIRSRQKKGLKTQLSMESAQDIGYNGSVCMPDVGNIVYIVYWRGNVIPL